jgi:hypothetical protein
MIGGSGPIGSRQIGGNGQFTSSDTETELCVTVDADSGTTGGIATWLLCVEEASATG